MVYTVVKSLSGDFGGNIKAGKLKNEIKNDGTITTPVDNINVHAGNVDIIFDTTLSGAELTQLDVLVATHSGSLANPQVRLQTSGSDDTTMILDSIQTVDRTITIPDATTTLVGIDTTQTLTNKTIAAGNNTISGLAISDITDLTDTGDLPEGSNLYYTEARVDANSNVAANTAKISADGSVTTHSDIVVTSVADNEVLAYNTATSKWINQTASEAGLATASHTHNASDINAGTLGDARVAESNVTQHVGALVHQSLSGAGTNTHAQIDTHIADTAIHETITASNKTGDQGVFSSKSGVDLQFKSLNQGTNISLTADANAITVNSTVGMNWQGTWVSQNYVIDDTVEYKGTAYICKLNTVSNEVPTNTTYWDVLAEGFNWTGTWDSGTAYIINDITEDNGKSYICILGHTNFQPPNATYWEVYTNIGEINTVSNIGTGGVGVFKQKTGVNFELKKINAGSTKVTITDDTGNNEIDIDVTESNIVHQNLSGAGTNTHVQIDTHIADATLHRTINDAGTSATELWSANKISTDLGTKSATSHTHDWDDATGAADSIPFNISLTAPAHSEGLLFYDKDEHTMAIYNDETEVTHQLGQEGYIRVYNDSGSTIVDGKAVYVSGTDGTEGRPTIALAKADVKTTSSVIGITTHSIENNTFGYITSWGLVNGLDTSSFSAGDVLYLDEVTAGALRNTPIPEGFFDVQIGFVTKVDAVTGKILVTIQPNLATVSGDSAKIILNAVKGSVGTINANELVYINGYSVGQSLPSVELADSSTSSTMPCVGIAVEAITDTNSGKIDVFGHVLNIDTSLFTAGDSLYVSETAGEFTNVIPTGAALVQKIGIVIRSHATLGEIEFFGAGRSNALPNLTDSKFWLGNGSGVAVETTTNSGFNLSLGTSAGTVSEGNHTHVVADVTDFVTSFNSNFDTRLGTKSTTNLAEGTNLYYTDARVSTWVDTQKGANNGLASLDGTGKVPASQLSLSNVLYIGTWNANTNTPTLVNGTGTQGNYYVVSVAGSTNIDGITDWKVGDWIIFNGTVWEKSDHTDQVTSVAGKQGAVTLQLADITDLANTGDLPEGSNLYYTEARVSANTDVSANVTHASSTSNPHSVTKVQLGLTNVLDIKHKIDATIAPTSTDDSGSNYSVGSFWTDVTADKSYVCVDSTASSAVWRRVDITSHTDLTNIGSNTHDQIDTHIGDATLHFTEGSIDHGAISGLVDDDHSQYMLLAGRTSGQTLKGGSAAGEDLTLESTSNASKGTIIVLDPVEVNDLDTRTATTLLIGKATATKVEIADTGIVTEVQGNLDALEGLDVTGNITVTGTVDGRDVAADGTSLDSHIANSAIHETITASNKTGDQGIFSSKSGVDLQFKSLTQGTNITLTSDANAITINSTVGVTWQGAWVSQNYVVDDIVEYNGTAYICKLNTVSNEVPTNTTYWDVLTVKGDQGIQGTKGMVWQSDWVSQNYVVDDTVAYQGATYICKLDTVSNEAPTNTTYWDKAAAKGDIGNTGSQGVQGVKGLQWQGAWGSGPTYAVDDVVEDLGIAYICTSGHTNFQPPNATYWDVFTNIGETNTSSSAGGTSLVKAKVGADLPFKGLTATSTKIALASNANDIGIDVTEANIVIGNLSGAPTGTVVGTTDTQTLTNKTLSDSTTYFADNVDNTKKLQLQLSGITTATTRTITIPDANTTLVGHDTSETLTNKTLTTPIISSISNTGTITLPTSTDTLVGRATTDTLTNKTVTSNTNNIISRELWVNSGANSVSTYAAPVPSANEVLVATSASVAEFKNTAEISTFKTPVRLATTIAGTLSTSFENGDTIDGVVLATNDRILIKDQATGSENGIYIVQASGSPSRATDLPSSASAAGVFVFTKEGTDNADKGWLCTNNSGSDVVATAALVFAELSGGGNLPTTTKGDLIVHNGTIDARLGVGTNNQVLIADSAEATGVKWGTLSESGVAAAKARRTTTYLLTLAYANLTFDTTDIENDTTIVEHDNTNTERITVKQTGTYLVSFSIPVKYAVSSYTYVKVVKNGTTDISPVFYETPKMNNHVGIISHTFPISLSANDYLALQMQDTDAAAGTVLDGAVFSIISLAGAQGSQGSVGTAGADGDITWQNAWVTSTAYTTNQAVENNGSSYVCISNHTSAAGDEPGVGGSWATYWDLMASKGDPGPAVSNTELSAATVTSTTSTTYVTMSTMTTTPASGTYMVSFSSSGSGDANGGDYQYAIFKAGTIIQHSNRWINVNGGTAASDYDCGMHSQAIVTVNGSELIEVKYKVNGGVFNVNERSLILLKI